MSNIANMYAIMFELLEEKGLNLKLFKNGRLSNSKP